MELKSRNMRGKKSAMTIKEEEMAAKMNICLANNGFAPDPETLKRIAEVTKKICEGGSRTSIFEWIKNQYGIGYRQSRKYYSAAIRFLIPEDMEEYRKELIQANIQRLETIIEDTMTTKGMAYTTAIQAIKELNKMLGLDNSKMVAVETPDTKFVIKLGDD